MMVGQDFKNLTVLRHLLFPQKNFIADVQRGSKYFSDWEVAVNVGF